MEDEALLRYSRHLLLPQIDLAGQEAFLKARVLIVGAGGLGCPVAQYLVASGVGTVVIADDDTVELSNLQRQILHPTAALGQPKVFSAQSTLKALNPEVHIIALHERLSEQRLLEEMRLADVVVDASDNFATRHAINRASVQTKTPLVSGAAVRFSGQLAVFDPRRENSACYHCLFAEEGEADDGPCSTFGVFAPLVGIIGSLQAAETLKLLSCHTGEVLHHRLLCFDALTTTWRTFSFEQDPTCKVCTVN